MPDVQTPTPAPSNPVAVMEKYLAAHDAPPHENAPERRAPKVEPSARASEGTSVLESTDDGGLDLDDATLEALGLASERKQPASAQEDDSEEDGADEGDQVDLDRLAKVLGMSVEDLSYDKSKGVIVKTKVDGEQAEVSLEELRKGYQLQKHFTRQQEQLLAEKQKWEQERNQQVAQVQQQAGLAMQVLQQEEVQLKQAYTLDWDTLRREDPAEYAAMVAEYNQKLSGLKQRQQQLVGTYQQQMAEQQQAREAKRVELMKKEQGALLETLGWKEPKVAQENATRLQNYLMKEVGFTERDLGTITDHRAFLLAEKARKYDEIMSKVSLARKKIAEAPTMPADSSTPRPKAASGRKRTESAMARLRQDHSIASAAEVFKQLKVV